MVKIISPKKKDDLEGRFGYAIKSFETCFIDKIMLGAKWDNLVRYYQQLLKDCKPEYIIGLQRKGSVILDEFEKECGIPPNYWSNNEDQIIPDRVKEKTVILFDDSAHTGNKALGIIKEIIEFKPRTLYFCPLLIPRNTRDFLRKQIPNLQISPLKLFDDYEGLTEYYKEFIMPVIGFFNRNMNNQFPILTYRMKGRITNEELIDFVKRIIINGDKGEIDELNALSPRDDRFSLVYRFNGPYKIIMDREEPYLDFIEEIEYCKIRVYMEFNGLDSIIQFVPMAAMLLDNFERCTFNSIKCPLFEQRRDEPSLKENYCVYCIVTRALWDIASELRLRFESICEESGKIIIKSEYQRPTTTGITYGFNFE